MAYYLMQVAATTETWKAMINNPHDRVEAVRPVIEGLGGSLEGYWLSFGEYDVVVICQMPDNVTAAALPMAVSASGAAKAVKTTPLMTIEEGIEALRKAGGAGYQPPSS